MKIHGHEVHFRLAGRVALLHDRLVRARYFRGHGVHSPFVYAVVRRVFMQRQLLPGDRALYRLLLNSGIDVRRAVQLQNLAIHCGYTAYDVNRAAKHFCIVTRQCSCAKALRIAGEAKHDGATVAVMTPRADGEWLAMCRTLVAEHRSTTVDNRGYLLIFNNYLPKQHFRI